MSRPARWRAPIERGGFRHHRLRLRRAPPWPTGWARTAGIPCSCWNMAARDIGPFIQMPARALLPDEHGALRLGLRHRAGAASRRPPAGLPARQGDRRLLLDQRHGLCARPCPRLRPLGRGWAPTAGPMPTCCPISSGMESWHDGGHGGDPDWRGTRGPAACHAGAARRTRSTTPSSRPGAQAGYRADRRL